MAFDKSKFTSIAAQTLSSNAEMHWLYETTDTSKDVYLSANGVLGNYFSEVYSLLSEGNIISVRHMSSTSTAANEVSSKSTPVDEIDYMVIYKSKEQDRSNRIFVYPILPGERLVVRHMDDLHSWTGAQAFEFPSNVALKGFGIAVNGPVAANYTLKLNDGDGNQLSTVQLTAAASRSGSFALASGGTSSAFVADQFQLQPAAVDANAVEGIVFAIVESSTIEAYKKQAFLTYFWANANAEDTQAVVCPVNGKVVKVIAAVEADPGANTTFTSKINGTEITSGAVTINNGSAAWTAVEVVPTAANLVAANQSITITNTASTNAVAACVTIVVDY